MKKIDNNDIVKYCACVIIIIIMIIAYAIYTKSRENYNYLKINKNNYLVYTKSKKQFGSFNQYTPYVNIKGQTAEAINNDIIEYLSNYSKNNIGITYDYDINGKILSLVLKIEDYSYLESTILLSFRSYTLNLDSLELLTNDQILDYYSLNSNDLNKILYDRINDYYYELVNNNYINGNECDFSCFCNSRKIEDGISDVELFIKNGKLIAYKPYAFMQNNDNSSNKKDYGFSIA